MPARITHVTPSQVREICHHAANEMLKPGAWSDERLASDAEGNPADVFSGAKARDALGWILKAGFDIYRSKEIGSLASLVVDSQIRLSTNDRKSLIVLSELGPHVTAKTFRAVATVIKDKLPPRYIYARNEEEATGGRRLNLRRL